MVALVVSLKMGGGGYNLGGVGEDVLEGKAFKDEDVRKKKELELIKECLRT